GLRDRLHVIGPPPAGLEGCPPHGHVAGLRDLGLPVLEGPHVDVLVDVLHLEGHSCPPSRSVVVHAIWMASIVPPDARQGDFPDVATETSLEAAATLLVP